MRSSCPFSFLPFFSTFLCILYIYTAPFFFIFIHSISFSVLSSSVTPFPPPPPSTPYGRFVNRSRDRRTQPPISDRRSTELLRRFRLYEKFSETERGRWRRRGERGWKTGKRDLKTFLLAFFSISESSSIPTLHSRDIVSGSFRKTLPQEILPSSLHILYMYVYIHTHERIYIYIHMYIKIYLSPICLPCTLPLNNTDQFLWPSSPTPSPSLPSSQPSKNYCCNILRVNIPIQVIRYPWSLLEQPLTQFFLLLLFFLLSEIQVGNEMHAESFFLARKTKIDVKKCVICVLRYLRLEGAFHLFSLKMSKKIN